MGPPPPPPPSPPPLSTSSLVLVIVPFLSFFKLFINKTRPFNWLVHQHVASTKKNLKKLKTKKKRKENVKKAATVMCNVSIIYHHFRCVLCLLNEKNLLLCINI